MLAHVDQRDLQVLQELMAKTDEQVDKDPRERRSDTVAHTSPVSKYNNKNSNNDVS